MLVSGFKILFQVAWTLGKIPIYILAAMLALFGFFCAVQFLYLYGVKGLRVKEGHHFRVKSQGFCKRLFVDAPRRILLDWFDRDPEFFRFEGVHLFCGEQGSGKTIAMVEMLLRVQREYPKCKCITNFGYEKENGQLTDWRQLLTYSNGQKGVAVGIDEMQNWFASGKDTLPPQMLEVVTQNRKNRRIIVATSQVFTRVAKGLREQCTLVYQPMTIFGAITWVRIKKASMDYEGNVKEMKRRGSYFFVHTPELRAAYDTYKVIHSLATRGFREEPGEITVKNYNAVITGKNPPSRIRKA